MKKIVGRTQNLIKNMILLSISSLGTKLIYFFLIPLYTTYLTTQDYGIVDLINTIISLVIPVITLGLIESVLKFIIMQPDRKEAILDCTFRVLAIDFIVILLFAIIANRIHLFMLEPRYYLFLVCSIFLSSLYQILCNAYRGMDLVKYMMLAGIVNALVTCLCNILFLAVLNWGINGYLAASLMGVSVSTLFLLSHMLLKKYYTPRHRKINQNLFHEMITYGKPLILNGISWWINNSLDRIIIVIFLGTSANGIYAVSYKIPSMLSVFQTIFNQAWTISAIQEIDSDDKDTFYSKMYRTYEAGMFLVCGALILFNMFFAKILYAKDFFCAWKYAIPLIIAALAGAMSVFASSIFCAVGETKIVGYTTTVGAIVNLCLNIILIPTLGLLGAAVATVISNIVIWIVRLIYAKKYIQLEIKQWREILCLCMLIIQAAAAYHETHYYFVQLIALSGIGILFREEINIYLNMINSIVKKMESYMKRAKVK